MAERLAFVGLGRMGLPMAGRLVEAGHDVAGFDVDPGAAERAAGAGVTMGGTVAEAVDGRPWVVTMLPDQRTVTAAAHGPDGVLAALAPGAVWVEMTSSHPDVTRAMAVVAAERSAELLDAPVSGGVAGARNGSLAIACAGSRAAFEAARPLLDVLAANVVHVSERPGDGDLTKTINNLLSAANLTIAAEGFALALAVGLAPERLAEYVNSSSGASKATSVKIPRYVLSGTFDADFTFGQYAKDLGIALDVAEDQGLELEIARRVHDLWAAIAADRADEDHTWIVRLVAERAGVEWKPSGVP